MSYADLIGRGIFANPLVKNRSKILVTVEWFGINFGHKLDDVVWNIPTIDDTTNDLIVLRVSKKLVSHK